MESKWQIGDAIVCVNDKNIRTEISPIKEGLKYIINDIRLCPTCGMMEFKISVPFMATHGMVCASCKTKFESEILDCWWCEHWRFRKEEKKQNVNVGFKTKEITKDIEIISN